MAGGEPGLGSLHGKLGSQVHQATLPEINRGPHQAAAVAGDKAVAWTCWHRRPSGFSWE